MTWQPNRLDSDGVTVHARVAHAAEYSIDVPLYHRRVGTGMITCRLLRSPTPAKRLVQLVAEYVEAGVDTMRVVQCDSEVDEVRQLHRLERIILEATRRPMH